MELRHLHGTVSIYAMLAIIFLAMSCLLFVQNNNYQVKNRELLLKNDSIASVNIDLLKNIREARKQHTPAKNNSAP